jgi:hypothetical protein
MDRGNVDWKTGQKTKMPVITLCHGNAITAIIVQCWKVVELFKKTVGIHLMFEKFPVTIKFCGNKGVRKFTQKELMYTSMKSTLIIFVIKEHDSAKNATVMFWNEKTAFKLYDELLIKSQ